MREKLKFRVVLELDFDVTPGEWQSYTEMEDDGDTPKVLHTVEEIVDDIKGQLEDWEMFRDMFDDAVYFEAESVRRIS